MDKKRKTTKLPTSKTYRFASQTLLSSIIVIAVIVAVIAIVYFFSFRTQAPRTLLARAVQTDSEININGSLDETAWSEVVPLTYAVHPAQNGSSTATVRFLWNDEYLYVGFDVNDTQVETADLSTLWDGDSVSVLLHDGGVAEHRQSLGAEQNDDRKYQLKPMTTLN